MKRYPILTYFILTFAISWFAALALHLIARNAGLTDFSDVMAMAETSFSLNENASLFSVPVFLIFKFL